MIIIIIIITRHSHRHSPRRAQGLSHVTGHQGQDYIGIVLSKKLCPVKWQNALDNSKMGLAMASLLYSTSCDMT